MPASITRSAPPSLTVPAPSALRDSLHRFLSGTKSRLADELLHAASHRPAFMQLALRRDTETALRFFGAGPQLVRARRLRHRVRARVLDIETYRSIVAPVLDPVLVAAVTAREVTLVLNPPKLAQWQALRARQRSDQRRSPQIRGFWGRHNGM